MATGGETLPRGAFTALLEEMAAAPPISLSEGWEQRLKPGAAVGRFELLREVGRGGFGIVYEARDRDLGRLVAFKAIRPGPRSVPRDRWLLDEAETVAQLNHPNIVTLHDVGTCESGPYLILELLKGETLEERLMRGPLPLREALRVAVGMARGLEHAHAAGVIHRDLKPGNVFLTEDGGVKLLDFGLAHFFAEEGAKEAGTRGFMAPEQRQGRPQDARADVYAAGVVLYLALCGRLPFGDGPETPAGPPPPVPGIPQALQALLEEALADEPGRRPRDGGALLEALLRVQRAVEDRPLRRWGLRAAVALAIAAAMLAGAFAARLWQRHSAAGERIRVAVADFANETGEKDLDGLSGMLITSLEQSRRLSVLSRSRMFDILKLLGREDAQRIDEPLARELGRRARVRALLLANVRRFDSLYTVDLRALDPVSDEYLFSVREQTGKKADVPQVIDRLSDRTREALSEREADIQASAVKVAEAVTPNLEAYQHYFLGLDCMDRSRVNPADTRECADEFRQAIGIDPAFSLAYYQLAFIAELQHLPTEERDEAMRSALAHVDRAPPKEQLLVRAWGAHLDGKDEEAAALYRKVVASFPDDKQVLYVAGDFYYHRDDLAAAIPYLEKVLQVDPGFEWALDHLAQALGSLGQRQELEAFVRRWKQAPPTAPLLHALTVGQIWLGDADGAVTTSRRAVMAGGGSAALDDRWRAYLFADRLAEAEAELRKLVAPGAPLRFAAYNSLASVLATGGRRREAWNALGELGRRMATDAGFPILFYLRALLLAGDGDPRPVWREAQSLPALQPEVASELAVFLAYLGDLEHADVLASGLRHRSPASEMYLAVVAWKKGDPAAARERLLAVDAHDPLPPGSFAPSFLLGELAIAAGEYRQAIAALERYRSLWPQGLWRSWAYPRSLYLLARAHEHLGERDAALREIDHLLRLWKRADPGLELLREARALRARVAG